MLLDVKQFGLSAHADSAQMSGVIGSLKPDFVGLIHGESSALDGFATSLRDSGIAPGAVTLELGKPYPLKLAGS